VPRTSTRSASSSWLSLSEVLRAAAAAPVLAPESTLPLAPELPVPVPRLLPLLVPVVEAPPLAPVSTIQYKKFKWSHRQRWQVYTGAPCGSQEVLSLNMHSQQIWNTHSAH